MFAFQKNYIYYKISFLINIFVEFLCKQPHEFDKPPAMLQVSCLVHFDIYILQNVSTFKYHQTNDGIHSMSACYFYVRSCVLFSFKKQTCEQCCSIAQYILIYTHAYTTRLRSGHVCLVGIDVVDDDDDPISEQLTIIIDD